MAKVDEEDWVSCCPCCEWSGRLGCHIVHRVPHRMDLLGVVCRFVVAKTVERSSYDETDDSGGIDCWFGLEYFGCQDGLY